MPKTILLAQKSREICQRILSTSSRTKQNARHLSVQLAIDVAKFGDLQHDRYGDVALLSNAISCTPCYAKRVLLSITSGNENDLFQHNIRCTAIHASKWSAELTKFVLLPENSRAVPGQEQVYIRYGVRHPKYLLLKSRVAIATEFKQENPDSKYSISTLMREFPQYAVTPTSRDLERNTCPVHANARRLIKVINKKLQNHKVDEKKRIPTCRSFVLTFLCSSPVVMIDPLAWQHDCVNGNCKNCPGVQMMIDAKILKETVTFSQWASKKRIVTIKGVEKEKYVFSLYTETTTMEEAIERLRKKLKKLAVHIFTAAKQWDAHVSTRDSLQ